MVKKLFALLLLASLFTPAAAMAQSGNNELSVTVSPAVFELAGNPGDIIDASLTFANDSNQPLAGFIEAQGLVPIDDIIDQGRRSQFDASSWITLAESSLAFEGNTQQEVEFQVAIPESANPGGHYAFLTLKPGIIQSETSDTTILPELSASVFITVAGDIVEQAELVEEDLEMGNVTRGTTTELSFRVRNTGNVHILPAPRITILKDGKQIEILSLQPQLILPNTEKTFSVDWESDVDFGTYSVKAEMTYGNQSIPLASSEYEFLVVPNFGQILLAVMLLPLIIFVIIKYKNIPRTIAVLRGHAHLRTKNYKLDAGDERLPKPISGTRTINEIAKEIEREPKRVLGYPETKDDTFFEENRKETQEKKASEDAKETKKVERPEVLSTTKVTEGSDTTTFITQTSASTIVREKSPFFDPQDIPSTPSEPTKIHVNDEPAPAPKPKTTKKAPAKKTTPKKTSAKKTAAKKKTPSKKSAAKKKTPTKTTKKTTVKTKKKTPAKKSSTAAKKTKT